MRRMKHWRIFISCIFFVYKQTPVQILKHRGKVFQLEIATTGMHYLVRGRRTKSHFWFWVQFLLASGGGTSTLASTRRHRFYSIRVKLKMRRNTSHVLLSHLQTKALVLETKEKRKQQSSKKKPNLLQRIKLKKAEIFIITAI